MVVQEDKTAVLGLGLELEGQVVGFEGLEPSVLAYCDCDTLATDMRCFADNAECYH